MVRLDGDGHVVFMDQQVVIRRGDLLAGHEVPGLEIIGRRKKVEECLQVGAGSHGSFSQV